MAALGLATVRRGAANGLAVTLDLARVIVPVFIAMRLLQATPVIDWLAQAFAPAMGVFGLPGEAALALMAGWGFSLYSAVGVITTLDLAAKQVTILAIMLSFAHTLVLEGAIAHKAGANAWLVGAFRLVASAAAGLLAHLIL